mmetsp:Transcript_7280/g.14931  ORF Transcript_7280/g.14931 Transcript_7280/m.14931 type:complete len:105 (+) Transcript_7280:2624-2938(+)
MLGCNIEGGSNHGLDPIASYILLDDSLFRPKALEEGRSAVVDNTNGSTEARKRYGSIAGKYQVPLRYVFVPDRRFLLEGSEYHENETLKAGHQGRATLTQQLHA